MLALLFRMFLTIVSLWLSLPVFFISNDSHIPFLAFLGEPWTKIVIGMLGLLSAILLTMLSLKMAQFLPTDNIPSKGVERITPANDDFLPPYLGYFFVAASLDSLSGFFVVFAIISILVYSSRISYFNPAFFLLCYKIYYINQNKSGIQILLITRRNLKGLDMEKVKFGNLKRINDFSFIDIGGEDDELPNGED